MDSSTELESMDQTEAMELNPDERNVLIEATNFFLFAQQKKGMVREADVKKVIAHARSKVAQEEIYYRMKEYLRKIIGYQVMTASNTRGNWLVVKNVLPIEKQSDDICNNDLPAKEKVKEGFLNAILMFLYMAKNPVSATQVKEQDLWKFIDELRHAFPPDLGDPNRLVGATPQAEFVSQGWIEYEKTPDANGAEIVYYSWGPRAKFTVDRVKLLKCFCAMDGGNPRQWKYHWKDANEPLETATMDGVISGQERDPPQS